MLVQSWPATSLPSLQGSSCRSVSHSAGLNSRRGVCEHRAGMCSEVEGYGISKDMAAQAGIRIVTCLPLCVPQHMPMRLLWERAKPSVWVHQHDHDQPTCNSPACIYLIPQQVLLPLLFPCLRFVPDPLFQFRSAFDPHGLRSSRGGHGPSGGRPYADPGSLKASHVPVFMITGDRDKMCPPQVCVCVCSSAVHYGAYIMVWVPATSDPSTL